MRAVIYHVILVLVSVAALALVCTIVPKLLSPPPAVVLVSPPDMPQRDVIACRNTLEPATKLCLPQVATVSVCTTDPDAECWLACIDEQDWNNFNCSVWHDCLTNTCGIANLPQ